MTRSTAQQLAAYQHRYQALTAQLADIGYISAGSLSFPWMCGGISYKE